MPITFPTTPLTVTTELAIGADLTADPSTWSWTDISHYVRYQPGITVTQGRRDERSVVQSLSAQLTLDNRDGRFSRRNPNSPYYGSLTFNTPIRVKVNPGTGDVVRLAGFVNEWPTRWSDRSGKDSTVPVQVAGIMRRLLQGTDSKSALRRTYTGKNQPTPAAYFPMEGGFDSTVVTSGLPGGRAMDGTVVFGPAFGGSAGSLDAASTVAGAASTAVGLANASGFQIEFVAQSDAASTVPLFRFICGTFDVVVLLGSAQADGLPHHVAYSWAQNGADLDQSQYIDGTLASLSSVSSKTLGSTLAIITETGSTAASLAHLAVYNFADIGAPGDRASVANGFIGEMAHDRISRLCDEEGVLLTTSATSSPTMGAQSIGSFLDVVREAETVDSGVLYEVDWGLGYQSIRERYNQTVALALDFKQRHIAVEPEPADDDQRLRNRWVATRTNGVIAVPAERTTGPLGSTSAGLYDDSVTVNIQSDSQLSDQAWWRVHLGTVDEDRWPSIALRFHGTPSLITSWTAMSFGARITVDNPPSQTDPNTIDAIVEGWTERFDNKSWDAVLNTSPASPYNVAIVSDPAAIQNVPRVGSDTATLSANITTSATSLAIVSGSGGLWTTAAGDFPLDINIGGERIRLSAISGSSSPQTATVSSRSVNGIVKAHTAGDRIEVWQLATVGL